MDAHLAYSLSNHVHRMKHVDGALGVQYSFIIRIGFQGLLLRDGIPFCRFLEDSQSLHACALIFM